MWPPAEPDYWSITRANRERAQALAARGFTDRQARFLVQVLLHAGVFVERQYAHFAGITHGQKTTDFLARLVERQYATPIVTGSLHRGRFYSSALQTTLGGHQRARQPVPKAGHAWPPH